MVLMDGNHRWNISCAIRGMLLEKTSSPVVKNKRCVCPVTRSIRWHNLGGEGRYNDSLGAFTTCCLRVVTMHRGTKLLEEFLKE